MSDHLARGFLDDIVAHPDDDTPRLIYADWLEDNGESARAEFIRVQIERVRLPQWDPRQVPLRLREEALPCCRWVPSGVTAFSTEMKMTSLQAIRRRRASRTVLPPCCWARPGQQHDRRSASVHGRTGAASRVGPERHGAEAAATCVANALQSCHNTLNVDPPWINA